MEGFSTKDAKIIRENEGKTPYDLLQLGLSQKGYERLLERHSEAAQAGGVAGAADAGVEADSSDGGDAEAAGANDEGQPLQPSEVERTDAGTVRHSQPQMSAPANDGTPLVQRTIVGPNGVQQTMAAKAAEKLATRYPDEYRLID